MSGFPEWHVKLALQEGDMLDGLMPTKISLESSLWQMYLIKHSGHKKNIINWAKNTLWTKSHRK